MAVAICPNCDEDINVSGKPDYGQKVVCRYCQVRLEVVEIHPLELDFPLDEDDEEVSDWDYDDDDF